MKECITLVCWYQGILSEASGLVKYPKRWICPFWQFRNTVLHLQYLSQIPYLLWQANDHTLLTCWQNPSWIPLELFHPIIPAEKPFQNLTVFWCPWSLFSAYSYLQAALLRAVVIPTLCRKCLVWEDCHLPFSRLYHFHTDSWKSSLQEWPWSVSRQLLNICKNRDSTTFLEICATSWSPSQQKKCFLQFKNLLCSSLCPLPIILPLCVAEKSLPLLSLYLPFRYIWETSLHFCQHSHDLCLHDSFKDIDPQPIAELFIWGFSDFLTLQLVVAACKLL